MPLQNITSEPVTFVVEHVLPDDWKVDSDPQPVKIVDNKAFFRVNAEPGQIVRMHVGEPTQILLPIPIEPTGNVCAILTCRLGDCGV